MYVFVYGTLKVSFKISHYDFSDIVTFLTQSSIWRLLFEKLDNQNKIFKQISENSILGEID